MGRNFHSKNEAVERRLNVLYTVIKTLHYGSKIAKFGVLWNGVSFLVLGATAPGVGNVFAQLVAICAASWLLCEYFGRQLRAEWDKLCPCPACEARRAMEKSIGDRKSK